MVLPVTLKNRTIENMWRTATKSATALPNNTNDNLFTISSGNVMIVMLLGEITVSIGSDVADLTFQYTPDGLSVESISADLPMASVGVAQEFIMYQGLGVDPTVGFVVEGQDVGRGIILGPGVIRILTSATLATGTVQWYCSWIPIDVGAGVIGA